MKIAIDQIRVDEDIRIRKDVGDIRSLEESIEAVGLINPLLIDERMKLLAGFRRLTACKNLGWKEVEVRILELNGDLLRMLDVEIAENFYRKDFTPEEILATEKRRIEILEELREKGLFERFWRWLKGLFTGKSRPQASPAAQQDPDKIAAAAISLPESADPADRKPTAQAAADSAESAATGASGTDASSAAAEEAHQVKEK